MRNRIKVTDLFAFWRYDGFPYILGAPVLEMDDEGMVQPKGYTGYWFKPIKLMPLEAGKKLHEKLESLRAQQREAKAAFDKEWKGKVKAIADFM